MCSIIKETFENYCIDLILLSIALTHFYNLRSVPLFLSQFARYNLRPPHKPIQNKSFARHYIMTEAWQTVIDLRNGELCETCTCNTLLVLVKPILR